MSKFKKALARLRSRPKDFTWLELQTVMRQLGYEEIKSSGSRKKFISTKTNVSIHLHEPHPQPMIKMYAIDIVLDHLKEAGLL